MRGFLKSHPRALAYLITVLIAVGSFFARLPAVIHRSLGGNESTTLLTVAGHAAPVYPSHPASAKDLRDGLFHGVTNYTFIADELKSGDGHPPIYYWSLASWNRIFGSGLTVTRLYSDFLGAVFVLILGLLFVSRLRLPQLIVFELVVAFSSVLSFYSTESRSYIFILVLVLLIIASALQSVKTARVRWLFYTGMLTGLAIFTNYLMVFTALATGLWLLSALRPLGWRANLRNAIWFALPNMIFSFLSGRYYLAQAAVHDSNRAGYFGAVSDLGTYGIDFPRTLINTSHFWLFAISCLALAGVLLTLLSHRKTREQQALVQLGTMLILFATGGLMLMNFLVHKHLYPYRYFIFATPGLWLLFGVSLALENKIYLQRALLTILILLLGGECVVFNWTGRSLGTTDYSNSAFTKPVRQIYREAGASHSTLVMIEQTDERDWHAGLIGEFADLGDIPVLVVPPGRALELLTHADREIEAYQTVWYLANDDQSESARQRFEAHAGTFPHFELNSRYSWGYRLVKNRIYLVQ